MKALWTTVSLLLLGVHCSKVNASLLVVSYNPLCFNLSFSQPTPLPKFQLLFNEIPINYTTQSSSPSGSYYIIEGEAEGIVDPASHITQKYVLMFTQPLTIAAGNLSLDSFLLRASKTQPNLSAANIVEAKYLYAYQNGSQGFEVGSMVLVVGAYLLAYSTLVGIRLWNFLALYSYICMQSSMFSGLDQQIAFYLLFKIDRTLPETQQVLLMLIPFMATLGALLVGLVSRCLLQGRSRSSYFWNMVYFYFTYKFFIITWGLMCVPVFVNVVNILEGQMQFSTIGVWFSWLYVYFGLSGLLYYCYMSFLVVNPQVGESSDSWDGYTQTAEFRKFDAFHLMIRDKDWKKRNLNFVLAVLRLITYSFIACRLVEVPNLIIQICYLVYLFILKPFKYEFFNYCTMTVQICVILFYLYRYIVVLYMSISDEITTSTDVTRIIVANIAFFISIYCIYVLLAFYEIFKKLRDIRNRSNFWNLPEQPAQPLPPAKLLKTSSMAPKKQRYSSKPKKSELRKKLLSAVEMVHHKQLYESSRLRTEPRHNGQLKKSNPGNSKMGNKDTQAVAKDREDKESPRSASKQKQKPRLKEGQNQSQGSC